MTAISIIKKAAIIPIYKPLDELLTSNKKYEAGRHIWVETDGKLGLKVGDWKFWLGDDSTATAFADLPWRIPPQYAGTIGSTPFKVRAGDTTEGEFPYMQVDGANLVITDPRLVSVDDLYVSTTQEGVVFRDADLQLDAVHGVLTILGFNELQDEEQINIIVPAQIRDAGSVGDLNARVIKLELLTAPLLSGALIWWPYALGDIPDGWRENEAMRGRFPMAYKPADADFGTIGQPGGSKTHTNTVNEMPPHTHAVVLPSRDLDNFADHGPDLTANPAVDDPDSRTFTTSSTGTGTPWNIMNPYLVGVWIELIPIS